MVKIEEYYFVCFEPNVKSATGSIVVNNMEEGKVVLWAEKPTFRQINKYLDTSVFGYTICKDWFSEEELKFCKIHKRKKKKKE